MPERAGGAVYLRKRGARHRLDEPLALRIEPVIDVTVNRTSKLKLVYFSLWATAMALGVGGLITFKFHPLALAVVVVLLLLPGRIVGYVWRDLITGRRLMGAGRFEQAIPLFESFVARVEKKPWIGGLIWIAPSGYTVSAKAMALNNLGACRLELGELEDAERDLKSAIELDAEYAIPHFNLAIVDMARGQEERSEEHLEQARKLGYHGGAIDQMLDRVKSAYAKLEPAARVKP